MAWRVETRVDDGFAGARVVHGNGVALEWAPRGPGWPIEGGWDWHEAMRVAARLSEDGTRLEADAVNSWRLPMRDEVVRSLGRHGRNAGGALDEASGHASYEMGPDKESPLWTARSEVIYWWTADESDESSAWSIAYNGRLLRREKGHGIGTLGFRLVREPAGLER